MLFVESIIFLFLVSRCEYENTKSYSKSEVMSSTISNCFVRWARKRGTIDVFIQAVLFRKIVQLAAYYASAICIVFARMNAESKRGGGGGATVWKSFSTTVVGSKVVEETREEECSFPEERSSRNLGNFFKISSGCLAAATSGNRANFQAWIHWKANFAVPRQPQKLSDLPIFSGYSRILEIWSGRYLERGAFLCKSFSKVARLFLYNENTVLDRFGQINTVQWQNVVHIVEDGFPED